MPFGCVNAERMALELTYEDTVTVKRMGDETVGAIDKMAPTIVYEAVHCALSRSGDNSKQTSAQQDIEYDATLFVAPDLKVLPGDTLEVTRFGTVYKFETVGRCAVYATHQQVFLKERGLG